MERLTTAIVPWGRVVCHRCAFLWVVGPDAWDEDGRDAVGCEEAGRDEAGCDEAGCDAAGCGASRDVGCDDAGEEDGAGVCCCACAGGLAATWSRAKTAIERGPGRPLRLEKVQLNDRRDEWPTLQSLSIPVLVVHYTLTSVAGTIIE